MLRKKQLTKVIINVFSFHEKKIPEKKKAQKQAFLLVIPEKKFKEMEEATGF